MNTYITLACLLAIAAIGHGSAIGPLGYGLGYGGYGYGLGYGYGGYGLGAPILAPAAISSANVVKAAPIPVLKTYAAPIITAPVLKTLPVSVDSWGYGNWGGYGLGGWGGYGLGWGGKGAWGGWGAPWGGYGWGKY